MTLSFDYESEPEEKEDDLVSFEAILLHWYEELQDMLPEEAREEISRL